MHALKYAHFSLFQGIITLSNLIFIFVVFICYHGISITFHMGMWPQMERFFFLFFKLLQEILSHLQQYVALSIKMSTAIRTSCAMKVTNGF